MPSSAVLLCLLVVSADLPAEKFNLSGQHRTRTCVEMKGAFVPLRFADGTPTGFWAHADVPSQQGSTDPCAVGTMEIDAHARLISGENLTTYFHPGGGSDLYLKNYMETGQYGHIARDDLKGAIKLIPCDNGKSAPVRSGRTYYATPTRIPLDMWYKPNATSGRSGARYATYGNPGYDKTYGRGDWTYISWSWVQTGGTDYAANDFGGGGIARALVKRGMHLAACDVKPILGISFGADNQPNGRVTALYARAYTGPAKSGSAIHGWLPHSYQQNNDLIVPCVRRTADPPAVALPASSLKSDDGDRMNRMAVNLLYEIVTDEETAKRGRRYWAKEYLAEEDALARMEILTEMSRLDQPATVAMMLQAIGREKDSRVREQAIVLIGYMRSTASQIEPVCRVMQKVFGDSDSQRERLRILEVMSNVPCRETIQLVRDIVPTLGTKEEDVELQIAAADAVLKLSLLTSVDEALARDAIEPLKRHAASAHSRGLRARMIRLLAAPPRNQLSFLLGLLKTEESSDVRDVITEVTANLRRGT
jgi:hypothetical protein